MSDLFLKHALPRPSWWYVPHIEPGKDTSVFQLFANSLYCGSVLAVIAEEDIIIVGDDFTLKTRCRGITIALCIGCLIHLDSGRQVRGDRILSCGWERDLRIT